MSKRFTDTDKYKKGFIRALEGPYKLLWDYLYHDCDHAGIWHVDFEVAQVRIGKDMEVTEAGALCRFNGKVIPFDDGEKWFIPSFVEFQYGPLNPDNRAHRSVMEKLQKYGLEKHLTSPFQGAMDKDKDKDKDKAKEQEKENHGEFSRVRLSAAEHAKLLEKHGEDRTAKAIETLDAWLESTGKRRKNHYVCLKEGSWVWEKLEGGGGGRKRFDVE